MEPIIGQIQAFGFNFAPRGWAFCDGQTMSIAENTALFSLLGTTFGGDGRTNFKLPNLQGAVPVHPGRGPGLRDVIWGERGGIDQTKLTLAQMPQHTHLTSNSLKIKLKTSTNDGLISESGQGENSLASSGDNPAFYSEDPNTNDWLHGDTVKLTSNIDVLPEGQNTSFSIMQPSLGVNYCIALIGIFPSRN